MRSVLAVVAGLISMMVLVVVATSVASALLLDDPMSLNGRYLVANLLYSAAAAVLGGYVASRLARASGVKHAVLLACVVAALGVGSALTAPASTGQPTWYVWTIAVLGVSGVLTGGMLQGRSAAAASARLDPRAA